MKIVINLLILGFSIHIFSCASILDGSEQTIAVQSNIDGAEVYFSDQLIGKTPLTVNIKKFNGRSLTVKKEGYTPVRIPLITKVSGKFLLNIPFSTVGGSTGATTDVVNGSAWEYTPGSFYFELQPEKGAPVTSVKDKEKAFSVINKDQLQKEKSRGQGEYLETQKKLQADAAQSEP